MSASDAARLIRSLVREPTTTEELFAIACNRLQDIRHDLAHGDFSVRDAYNPPDAPILEQPVQNLLAQELEHRRRGQYSVAREPEVTRAKKPDIRLFNARCDGPVTVEVKIAERWRLPDLEDGLREQLVGTYMRANNSRYGVFVVCSSGPIKPKKGAPGTAFRSVVARLRDLARDIQEHDPNVSGLAVVDIDFH
jgi:hypothetical protein